MLSGDDEDRIRSEKNYQSTLQAFASRVLELGENEGNPGPSLKSHICQEVWLKFAEKHQKSPTHVNNNVHKCYKAKIPISTVCRLLFHSNENKTPTANSSKTSITDNHQKIYWGISCLVNIIGFSVYILKLLLMTVIFLVLFYCLNVFHKPTQTFVSRHTQDLIYPFMRSLRLLSLPIVRSYPALTNFYEESCLISNPFFTVDNIDCWPCENVRHIPDLTGFSNFSTFYHHSGIPFVVKDGVESSIEVEDLRRIFLENPEIVSKLVDLNLNSIPNVSKLFDSESTIFEDENFHMAWKVNRVELARRLREYFPKPYFIPTTTEVSVQHYLFLDNSKSPTHTIPVTEFANVFLTQASGSRHMVLLPTENCQKKCRVVSIILEPKDVLFYNWLFWRPISVPVESSLPQSNTSVTYIGSFY